MAHRFRDPAPSTPNSPAKLGGHDHYHRFLRRLFGPQVRSASRSQGHLDRTTASAGLCCRANSLRSNQPNLCGMMWAMVPQRCGKDVVPNNPKPIFKAALRAKEIAAATWAMALTADGTVGEAPEL